MSKTQKKPSAKQKNKKLKEAIEILHALGFGAKQCNATAGYTLLALIDLKTDQSWNMATAPLRGITPIIEFIRKMYRVKYAPNTRETIRDEAVKYFVEAGLLIRNTDNLLRPTNSGKTVYQIEPSALKVIQSFGSLAWSDNLAEYLKSSLKIRQELQRQRKLARIPVKLPSGEKIALSPGGQNPLIKKIVEEFCTRSLREERLFISGMLRINLNTLKRIT